MACSQILVLFATLLAIAGVASGSGSLATDCAALQAFKSSITNPKDADLRYFLMTWWSTDPCFYGGVVCVKRRVVEINFMGINFDDEDIFPVVRANYSKLVPLNKLQNLTMNFPNIPFPRELLKFPNLKMLWMHGLRGDFPAEISKVSTLQELRIGFSRFRRPIFPHLAKMPKLRILSLYAMSLSGPLPLSLLSLTNLTYLDLSQNHFRGPIPTAITNLRKLQQLHIFDNNLTGPIPPTLSRLKGLTHLDLSYNNLAGHIPPQISTMTKLSFLSLGNNPLGSPIPRQITNLKSLSYLSIPDSQLRGILPTDIGKLKSLKYLELSNNRLGGLIPSSIGELSKLYDLYLDRNRLTGPIPPALRLGGVRLSLAYNYLNGTQMYPGGAEYNCLEVTECRHVVLGQRSFADCSRVYPSLLKPCLFPPPHAPPKRSRTSTSHG